MILKLHERDIKLLAVDSDQTNLLLLEETLKSEGVAIDCCDAGEKAIELIKKNHYDAVLLDIVLPGMDGFELRNYIRAHDPYLPMIFLAAIIDSAYSDLLEKIAADKATYYLRKPFELSRLLEMIENVVKTHRSEDQMRKYYNVLEENLNLASEVQHLLLPDWIRMEDDLIMSSLYRPVYKVSGDIFDAIEINPGRYFIILGDIAGHGIQAALYMSAIQALVKSIIVSADDNIRIDDILNSLNSFFCVDMQGENYMTCLAAVFDFNINKLQFISAGHLDFFMHDTKSGETKLLSSGNRGAIPVGWVKDYGFSCINEAIEIDFDDDSIFFGVTDGIVETSNKNGRIFGVENLRVLIQDFATEEVPSLVPYHVCHTMEKTGYTVIEDDICMIMIKKSESPENQGMRLQLTTKPDISQADLLGLEYEKFIIENTNDERLAVQAELLLSEFLNNIIMHGLKKHQQERPRILVDLLINDADIVVKVWDKGKPWTFNPNPITIDEKIWDDNNKYATAGRGMAIIKSIAGKIECTRYGDLNETSFIIAREG